MKKSPKTPASKVKGTDVESIPYVPKTEEERAEAFRLADELLSEFAKEEALRELLAESLPISRKC